MASRPATKAKKAPAPKAAAKKPGKPAPAIETVTLRTVFEQLAEAHQMPVKQAHAMASEMVGLVTGHLMNGARVRISGLGMLEVKDRPARTGRHPVTGEAIQIPASKTVAFRPAKELKEAV